MRIQEVELTTKSTGRRIPKEEVTPFIGQVRHFTFNGVSPFNGPGYLLETPLLKSSTKRTYPALTLRNPDCYLRLPKLNLYGQFQLAFALKTHQQDGVILFNSGEQDGGGGGDGDFLAVELVRGQLTLSFDMGHGAALQHQIIARGSGTDGTLSDGSWHHIAISR